MLSFPDPPWIHHLKQLPRVHPRQAHRISDLARKLAQSLAPDAYTDEPTYKPLSTAATGLAEYLDGRWTFPQRNSLGPPPKGWDPQYARNMLGTAMQRFDADIIGNPREPREELEIRRTAFQLAMVIIEAGYRNDPRGLLDKVVQGKIDQVLLEEEG